MVDLSQRGNVATRFGTVPNLPQYLRRAKPQVAFCLHKIRCVARLSAKPRIFTRNTLTIDVFFRLLYLRTACSRLVFSARDLPILRGVSMRKFRKFVVVKKFAWGFLFFLP